MAYTKAQLEALNNELLASNQPIPAVKHRQFNKAQVDEMFDAQSRGNLLKGVQDTVSVNDDDSILLIKANGQAYLIRKIDSGFGTPVQHIYQNLPDEDIIALDLVNRIVGIAKLETTKTAVTLNITNLLKGSRQAVLIKKISAADLVLTPNYNSLPVSNIGDNDTVTSVTLTGEAGKTFLLEIISTEQVTGLSEVNPSIALSSPRALFPTSEFDVFIGGSLKIRKSVNSGSSFTDNFLIPTPRVVQDIHFLNPSLGLAVAFANGFNTPIYRTVDGGNTWQESPIQNSQDQSSCWIESASIMYTVTRGGSDWKFGKSTDGGVTWVPNPSALIGSFGFLHCIFGTSASKLFICGGFREIWKSSNGGTSWTDIKTTLVPSDHIWRALAFENDNIGYIVGDNFNIYKTTNAGALWINLPISSSIGSLYGVAIIGSNKVIVCGTGGVGYSIDGGATWNVNSTAGDFVKVKVVDESNIFLLTSTGRLYKYIATLGTQILFAVDGANSYTKEEIDEKISEGGGGLPTYPASDGKEYYLAEVDAVPVWREIIDANGAGFDSKEQLQAGDTDDWDEDDHYVGTTSGVITGTNGGMVFYGTDAASDLKYRYECVTDNNWYRVQRVIA